MSDWADEKAQELHRGISGRSCAEGGDCVDMMARCYCLDEQRVIAIALREAVKAERGANVDAIDKRGTPPLVWACLAGGFEIVKALLEKGADVNIVDDFTPLHYASRMGSLPIVEALLDKGANVNATEKRYGRTPLHLASLEGHIEVVNALLGRGANVQATDGEGMTPADLAEDEGVLGLLAAEWRRRSPYRTRRNWRGSTALWLDSSGKVV